MNLRKAAVVIGLAVFGSFGIQTVQADDFVKDALEPANDDFIKERTYFSAVVTSTNVDDLHDFDGTKAGFLVPYPIETTPVSIYSLGVRNVIPGIDRNFGFGLLMGHRQGPYAMEFSYWRTLHSGYWGAFTMDAVLSSVNLDLKRYLLTKYQVQPFFGFGLHVPWLTSKRTSTSYNFNVQSVPLVEVGDATVSGIGLNTQVGLEIYLGDGFSITGAAIYRWTAWGENKGNAEVATNPYFGGDPDIKGNYEGNGLNFCVGTTIGFE